MRASGSRWPKRRRIMFEYVMLAGVNDSTRTRASWSRCSPASRPRSTCCRSMRRPGFRSSARRTSGSTPSRRSSPTAADGVGAQEPRPRHSRRVRTADCRRSRHQEIGRPTSGRGAIRCPRRASACVPRGWCCVLGRGWLRRASRSRGRDLQKQLPAIAVRAARRGDREVHRRQRRHADHREPDAADVFFAKDKDGVTPRVVGDFNAWAVTPKGYDAAIGKTDAHRRHVLVVSREHVVHQCAPRIRAALRQGVQWPIR